MTNITIKGKTFTPIISKERIQEQISVLAQQINTEYEQKSPLFVVVLNGAFMFASDLIKLITIPCEVTFIRLSSYQQMRSTGSVTQLLGLQERLENRHVIVVEDIIDTGNTIEEVKKEMLSQNPQSIEIATFLIKPPALKKNIIAKYTGFEIPDKFVLGYGLDYDGYGRNTQDLYVLA